MPTVLRRNEKIRSFDRSPSFATDNIHRTLTCTACIRVEGGPFHGAHEGRDASMRRKLAFIMALLALAGTAPLLTACYTTQGAGQDLQAAGHGLENSAERHTPYQP